MYLNLPHILPDKIPQEFLHVHTQNKDIYNGYLYQTRNNTSGNEYVFFKEG